MNRRAICTVCKAPLLEKKGTINRRWLCPNHGEQGGDKLVDWEDVV
jgi:uncharacterized Zn finger protein (UPF0148 family)